MSTSNRGLQKYIPGVCNIGPAERAGRRRNGLISLVITFVLLEILLILHAPKAWRLILFLPAAGAASGFLQDLFHFCAGFGLKGLYNVANSLGTTESITQQEFRRKDKRKALSILYLSIAIGIIFALVTIWL